MALVDMADRSSFPVWRIPWTKEPEGLHSPLGCKESDTTEATLHEKELK